MVLGRKKIKKEEVIKKYTLVKREIDIYHRNIKGILKNLEFKMSRLYDKYNFYLKRKDLKMAVIYKREIENLKTIRSVLSAIELGVLAVTLRIDTLRIVLSAILDLRDTTQMLVNTLNISKLVSRQFDSKIRDFIRSYLDFKDIVIIPDVELDKFIELSSEDAKKIVSAVERKIGEELSKRFPLIPKQLDEVIGDDIEAGVRKLYSILATDGGIRASGDTIPTNLEHVSSASGNKKQDANSQTINTHTYFNMLNPVSSESKPLLKVNMNALSDIKRLRKLDSLEISILKYIVNIRRGKFTYMDIYRIAKIYRVPPIEVIERLYDLASSGIISFRH